MLYHSHFWEIPRFGLGESITRATPSEVVDALGITIAIVAERTERGSLFIASALTMTAVPRFNGAFIECYDSVLKHYSSSIW